MAIFGCIKQLLQAYIHTWYTYIYIYTHHMYVIYLVYLYHHIYIYIFFFDIQFTQENKIYNHQAL